MVILVLCLLTVTTVGTSQAAGQQRSAASDGLVATYPPKPLPELDGQVATVPPKPLSEPDDQVATAPPKPLPWPDDQVATVPPKTIIIKSPGTLSL